MAVELAYSPARKRFATKRSAGGIPAAHRLTSPQIAEAWCAGRGLKTDDGTLVTIRKRVGACLIALRVKHLVADLDRTGEHKLWAAPSR